MAFWFSPLPTAYQKKPYLCTVFRTDRIMSPRSVYRLILSFNGSKRDKSERLCAYYSGTQASPPAEYPATPPQRKKINE